MKRGISLIETLISLTIVGISLVALLPVMTVRKTAYSEIAGNALFNNSNNVNNEYYTPAQNLVIGKIENPENFGATRNFEIITNGIGNIDVVPLYINNTLLWNNFRMQPLTNGLLISAGAKDATLADGSIRYPQNIFFNEQSVMINNGAANNYTYAVKKEDNGTYTLNKSFLKYDRQQIQNNDGDDIGNGANLLTMKLTSLSSGANELLHVSNPDFASASPPAIQDSYHVGIGQNAIGLNNFKYVDNDKTFIGIYNGGADNTMNAENAPTIDLAIGRNAGANDYTPNSFVISHTFDDNIFHFNPANTLDGGGNTITAGKILLASDKRLKNILYDYKKGLKEVLKIKPVEFIYKNDPEQKHHIGVIAQDLKKIIPQAVSLNPSTGYYMVSHVPVFYTLINSIKDLNANYENMKKDNDALEAKVAKLRKIRDDIKASQGGANE